MIVTFTPNPSLDITLSAPAPIARGSVARMHKATTVAGGKGINVSAVLHCNQAPTVAIVPCDPQDPFARLLALTDTPFEIIPTDTAVRVNTTVVEPDGVTTKLNSPGDKLDAGACQASAMMVELRCQEADWLVLAGSLPPGPDPDFYLRIAQRVRKKFPQLGIALDTSGAALKAAITAPGNPFTLFSPNTEELVSLVDTSLTPEDIEEAAAQGNIDPAISLCREVLTPITTATHTPQILLTLGAAGALLVDCHSSYFTPAPEVEVSSTVGAGDCALAGFVHAAWRHHSPSACVDAAVTYGCAAVTLPGTTAPSPEEIAAIHPLLTHPRPAVQATGS